MTGYGRVEASSMLSRICSASLSVTIINETSESRINSLNAFCVAVLSTGVFPLRIPANRNPTTVSTSPIIAIFSVIMVHLYFLIFECLRKAWSRRSIPSRDSIFDIANGIRSFLANSIAK